MLVGFAISKIYLGKKRALEIKKVVALQLKFSGPFALSAKVGVEEEELGRRRAPSEEDDRPFDGCWFFIEKLGPSS